MVVDIRKLLLLVQPVRWASMRHLDRAVSAAAFEVDSVAEAASETGQEVGASAKEEEALATKAVVVLAVVATVDNPMALAVASHRLMRLPVPAAAEAVVAATALVGMAARTRMGAPQVARMAITLRMDLVGRAVGMAIREEAAHMMTADPHTAEVDHRIWTAVTVEGGSAAAAIGSR